MIFMNQKVLNIVDNKAAENAVDTRFGNQDDNDMQVFKKPPPSYDIQPSIDEIRRESYMDQEEILPSLQKKLHKGQGQMTSGSRAEAFIGPRPFLNRNALLTKALIFKQVQSH